jgi:Spy/CpxP family protein refolding chaperone
MKNKYLIYISLIVLVFIAGIFAYRILQPSTLPEQNSETLSQTTPGQGFNRTANILGFDNEQRQSFNEMELNYRTELAGLTQNMQNIEANILTELSKNEPDKTVLQQYAAETGIIQAKIKQLTIDHFLNIKKVCTPEQAKNLDSLFNEMQHGFRKGMGHRKGSGNRQGQKRRQLNN